MFELGLTTTGLPPNTGSDGTWSVVKEWIKQCSTQHRCLAPVDDWYPTRLVEWMHGDMFRVVRSDSGTFCRGKRYITLSHRWGTGDFLRLCTSNLSDLEQGLPIKRLRKTFQDTLTIAQRLGIPYVWIDSLCIIQSGDDNEDWRRESQTMAEVYSKSFCNISADYGDEENGLFYQRKNEPLDPMVSIETYEPPFKLHVRWKKQSKKACHEPTKQNASSQNSSYESTMSYIVRRIPWKDRLATSPLNRRGWVMQERLLAPRVLSFTPRLVSWNCGRTETNEIWPRRVFNSPVSERLDRRLNLSPPYYRPQGVIQSHTQHRGGEQDARALIDWWYELLDDYTRCELTKESDRLVAIAGVARKLRPIVGDQYVAGLWAGSLPWALLWKSRPYARRQPAAANYSPTFSWAACPARVDMPPSRSPQSGTATPFLAAAFIRYRSSRLSPTAVQKPAVQLLKDDIFGPLTSPEVEVQARGSLRSCRLTRQIGLGPTFIVHPSTRKEACSTESQVLGTCSKIEATMDHEIDIDENTHAILYYAAVVVGQRRDVYGYHLAEGLLLELEDANMGRFKRVGHISQRCDKTKNPDLLRLLGNERDLPAWSFDEATGEHTFYIV